MKEMSPRSNSRQILSIWSERSSTPRIRPACCSVQLKNLAHHGELLVSFYMVTQATMLLEPLRWIIRRLPKRLLWSASPILAPIFIVRRVGREMGFKNARHTAYDWFCSRHFQHYFTDRKFLAFSPAGEFGLITSSSCRKACSRSERERGAGVGRRCPILLRRIITLRRPPANYCGNVGTPRKRYNNWKTYRIALSTRRRILARHASSIRKTTEDAAIIAAVVTASDNPPNIGLMNCETAIPASWWSK